MRTTKGISPTIPLGYHYSFASQNWSELEFHLPEPVGTGLITKYFAGLHFRSTPSLVPSLQHLRTQPAEDLPRQEPNADFAFQGTGRLSRSTFTHDHFTGISLRHFRNRRGLDVDAALLALNSFALELCRRRFAGTFAVTFSRSTSRGPASSSSEH